MGLELNKLEEVNTIEVIRITTSPDKSGTFYVGYSFNKSRLYEPDIAFTFLIYRKQLMIKQDNEKMKFILENMLNIDLELVKDSCDQYRLNDVDFDNKNDFISFCQKLLWLILRYGKDDLNITMN